MAVPENLITTQTITNPENPILARAIDFISSFQSNWAEVSQIMGITRPIRKTPGTKLEGLKTVVNLASPDVAEGEETPLSEVQFETVPFGDLKLKPYAKAVSAQAIEKFGAKIAVRKSDAAFLTKLQNEVLNEYYDFLLTGTLGNDQTYSTFQMALSMARSLVVDAFDKMDLDTTGIVAYANTLDVGEYLGAHNQLTTQKEYGIEYLKNFLGVDTLIVTSRIPRGKVVAVPVDNIVDYYIDPEDNDFREAGLVYTTWGDTRLIGVHIEGDHRRNIGLMEVLMGHKLFAEYLDGIAVVNFKATGEI